MTRTPNNFPLRSVCTIIEKRHENIQKFHIFNICHIDFSQHSTHLYLMNNVYRSAVYDHIGSMDHHIVIIQKRCRVCGNLLVATGKRKRFYQCSEFAAQLFSVFSIDISNDVPGTHPSSFCYSCKQVLDRYLQAQDRNRCVA